MTSDEGEAVPATGDADTGGSVRALGRGLEILEQFTAAEVELTQKDLAARCNLPMPTIHRLVKTLAAHEFLQPVAGGRSYRLGNAIIRLAAPLIAQSDPAAVVRHKLQELSADTGETVNLATLMGSSVVYLDGVTGSRLLTPRVTVGLRLPAHNTALGKALLAELDDQDIVERLGDGPYEQSTPHTATNWADLRPRLDAVRASGVAVSDEEFEIGLTSIAVALSSRQGGAPRAINISLPTSRATSDFRERASTMLLQAADNIATLESRDSGR
jgi:DNA-binding IclR family transcriptional regulator